MKRHNKVGWRARIFIVGSLLPVLFMIWLPMSISVTHQLAPQHVHGGVATSPQETPTVDPTVTALEKEKLEHDNGWLWNFGATLLSTLALVIAGVRRRPNAWCAEEHETRMNFSFAKTMSEQSI